MPKRDLVLARSIMNAAGTLGFVRGTAESAAWPKLDIFVTNPISWNARSVAREPVLRLKGQDFLLHTGLPNPGFRAALRQFSRRWADSKIPTIVHLMASGQADTARMVRELEELDGVVAIELGFAADVTQRDLIAHVAAAQSELPVIASLPTDKLNEIGARVLDAGADFLSCAAPRLHDDGPSEQQSLRAGRIYGTSLLQAAVDAVRSATVAGLPVIGANGVFTHADTETMFEAGAVAVQVDAALWLPLTSN